MSLGHSSWANCSSSCLPAASAQTLTYILLPWGGIRQGHSLCRFLIMWDCLSSLTYLSMPVALGAMTVAARKPNCLSKPELLKNKDMREKQYLTTYQDSLHVHLPFPGASSLSREGPKSLEDIPLKLLSSCLHLCLIKDFLNVQWSVKIQVSNSAIPLMLFTRVKHRM